MSEENDLPLSFLEKVIYRLFTKDIFDSGYTSCEDHDIQLMPYKKKTNEGWQLYGRCPECHSEKPIISVPNKIAGRIAIYDAYYGQWDDDLI